MKYRVLCLTDHDRHSAENSLYAIANAIARHPQCEHIFIASRSSTLNTPFFEELDFAQIYAHRTDAPFSYEQAKSALHTTLLSVDPTQFDIILLRLPRPISDVFLTSLENHFSTQCIINKPSGIVESSSKSVLLRFPSICPPIKLCKTIEEINSFSEGQDIVLKPLKEYGGKGLLKIQGDILNDGKQDHDTQTYLSSIQSYIEKEGYLAMQYLKNVTQGDKRLLVVDGAILGASLRLPATGSWLCNVAMGGKSMPAEADEQEKTIIHTINPYLKENGILIYGADTLVDNHGRRVLSEINTLSVGGFPQAEKQSGKAIIQTTIQKIFDYAEVQLRR